MFRKFSIRPILFAALAAAIVPLAAAQEMEEIQVTATRGADRASEVVNAVSVVSSEAMQRAQPAIITDVLHGTPGVFIQQTTPGQGTVIVRGLKGSEILHLVDGMRLNNALFRNSPNQYLALVDPWIVSRTEVVRGPLSSTYGSDAMGGVVHLITRRPTFTGEQYSTEFKARLAFDSATLGETVNTSFAMGNQNAVAGGTFSYQHLDHLRGADGLVQAPSAFSARSASLFGNLTTAKEHHWDLSVQYLEQPSTPRYDELVPGFGQTEASSEQFFFTPNSRLFVHGTHRSSGYNAWLQSIEVHVGLQTLRDGRRTQDTGSTSVRTEDNRSALLGLTIQATASDMGRHQVTYGLDLYHDMVTSERQQTDITTGDVEQVRARFPDGSTLTNIDAFVHDRISLNARSHIDAGLRFSQAEVDLTATEATPATTISNFDISGSTGLRYAFSDSLVGVANLARGFRAPNIFDLGTLGARPGNRFNIANTSLEPETVLTGELGVRIKQPAGHVEAVLWGSDYKDKIVSVSTGDVDASGRDIVQSQNASTVKLYGAEIGAELKYLDDHTFNFSLTYTRGDTENVDGTEESSDRIPPLNGRLAWRYTQANWWLGSEILFADEQNRLSARDVRDPRINPLGTPGWGSFNAMFGFQPKHNWRITGRLNNLLDQNYRRHGSGINSAGRHLQLSVDAKF